MRCAIIRFPGSNCDRDCFWAFNDVLGIPTEFRWHREDTLDGIDIVIIPGGFSYGDYLRTGAIARFSPIMNALKEFVKKGRKVIGICNGFQILLESGLLPGAMLKNTSLKFICKYVYIRTETTNSPFTASLSKGQILKIPIAHYEGNYFADEDTIKFLKDNDLIVFRYCDKNGNVNKDANPNGSIENIAGILNKERNILGMMPHPERAMVKLLGSEDGKKLFQSLLDNLF